MGGKGVRKKSCKWDYKGEKGGKSIFLTKRRMPGCERRDDEKAEISSGVTKGAKISENRDEKGGG